MKINSNSKRRVIFHIDGDSFFVSAEQVLRPELKGQEVVIGYDKSHSIVVAVSYEAKNKGIKVPMKMYEVKKILPNIKVIKPNHKLYEDISQRIYNFIYANYSRYIEIGSIDEWYVDVTNYSSKYSSPLRLAKKLQKDIYEKIGVSVSIGISYNKFLAKMAANLNKPYGVSIIRKKDIPILLWPLDINKYTGIGKSLSRSLMENGIKTIGDLAKISPNDSRFIKIFKNKINHFIDEANGISDDRIDLSNNESSSIGAQHSFELFYSDDLIEICKVLKHLCSRISQSLEQRNLVANSMRIYLRYQSRANTTGKKLRNSVYSTQDIYNQAFAIFSDFWDESPIHTLGVSVSSLETKFKEKRNISLFDESNEIKEENKVVRIINEINDKMRSNHLKLISNKK